MHPAVVVAAAASHVVAVSPSSSNYLRHPQKSVRVVAAASHAAVVVVNLAVVVVANHVVAAVRDVIDIMAKKFSDVLMPQQDALPNMGCNGMQTFNQPPPALCNQIPLNQQGPACQGAGLGNMNGLNFNGPAGLGLHHSFHQLPVIHPGGAGPINNMPMNIHNLPNPNNNFNPNMVNHLGEIDLGMLNGCENGCGGNCGGGSCGPMNGIGPNGNCGGGGCGPMNGLGQNGNCGGGCGPMGMNGNGNGCNSGDCSMFGGNGNGNCPPCSPGRRRRRRQIGFPFMDALRKVAHDISVSKNATHEHEASRSDVNGQKMLVLRNNLELVLRQDKQKIDSESSSATAQSNI
ncbi:hypothetical protein Ddc_01533 [Ditylenchus destructor]|nr:hypothetical protein Ddc_01533 [Ditylenchus destructor]